MRDSSGETGSTNLSITVINVNDAPSISIDSTSPDIVVAGDGSVTASGYEMRSNGNFGIKFSSLDNSQISISDDDYSGSGLPQLLLWLKFDEDSGTTALDSSGNTFMQIYTKMVDKLIQTLVGLRLMMLPTTE